MREDIKRLLEMICFLECGDEINTKEFIAIAEKYNFAIDEGVIDLEEDVIGLEKAIVIIRELTIAMERWGRWEDGIPDEFWNTYKKAKTFIGDSVSDL